MMLFLNPLLILFSVGLSYTICPRRKETYKKKKKKKDPQDFKLINTKAIGYKQCKNTVPVPKQNII